MPSVTEEASNLQRKEETDREKGIRLHSRIKHFLEKVQERPVHEILEQYRGTTPEFDQFLSFYQTFCVGKKWKVARVGNQLAVEYSVVGRTGEGERLLQGRIDAIFMDPSNKYILVDWKRSCTREGKYFSRSNHQLNLYESILQDEPYHCTIAKKMIVNLHPNLTDYEIIPVSVGHVRTNEQRLMDIIEKMVGIQAKHVESTFGDNLLRGNECNEEFTKIEHSDLSSKSFPGRQKLAQVQLKNSTFQGAVQEAKRLGYVCIVKVPSKQGSGKTYYLKRGTCEQTLRGALDNQGKNFCKNRTTYVLKGQDASDTASENFQSFAQRSRCTIL